MFWLKANRDLEFLLISAKWIALKNRPRKCSWWLTPISKSPLLLFERWLKIVSIATSFLCNNMAFEDNLYPKCHFNSKSNNFSYLSFQNTVFGRKKYMNKRLPSRKRPQDQSPLLYKEISCYLVREKLLIGKEENATMVSDDHN